MTPNRIRFVSSRRKVALAAPVALAAALLGGSAFAVTKQECAAAYEQTQSLQRDKKLISAREKALFCSQDACPGVVRGDCAKWLAEIEASQPTVVFSVVGADGQETADARVSVDGKELVSRTDGKAVAVDPGERRFVFEVAGSDPIQQTLVLREGEKLRQIDVSFVKHKSELWTPKEPDKQPERPGVPAAVIALGVIGAVGIGVGATFGGLGLLEKGDLETSCAPFCTAEEVNEVRVKLLIADLAVSTGLVLLTAGTAFYFLSRESPRATKQQAKLGAQFSVMPTSKGAFATVRLSF